MLVPPAADAGADTCELKDGRSMIAAVLVVRVILAVP
jgi:hypothetical protein